MKYFLFILACVAVFLALYLFIRLLVPQLSQLHYRVKQRSSNVTFEDLLQDRMVCFALLAALGCVLSAMLSFWLLPICLIVAFLISKKAPTWLEKKKRAELREACEGQLDVMSDILAMGTQAGLSFDSSLKLFCDKFKTILALQMNMALLQWQSGVKTRREVLKEFAEKIDSKLFARFEKTVTNAIAQGAPMADLLTRFAVEMRKERSAQIEQAIEKAPIKMLIPMGTCILPAMLILVMGPVLLQFTGAAL